MDADGDDDGDDDRPDSEFDAVETNVHIDCEICGRRVQRTQMNVTSALAPPKEQHKRENK
jgi:hypothetical protein